MANFEEKVKAFLNDEEKIKSLANDKEFIEKISDGTATNKTIAKKFGELGLELNEDQAKKINKVTGSIINTPIEKLQNDASLTSIVGGGTTSDGLEIGGILTGTASGIAAVACTMGWLACNIKASNAKTKYDKAKCKNMAQNLSIAAVSFAGGTALGAGIFGAGRLSNILGKSDD